MTRLVHCLFFSLVLACGAAHSAGTELQVAVGVLDFAYKSIPNIGDVGRESGRLPGVVLELAQQAGDWRFSGELRYFSGSVDVAPATTDVTADARIRSLTGRVARHLHVGKWAFAPYVGYGYHDWRRDFDSSQPQGGGSVLLHSWKTFEVGVQAALGRWGQFEAGGDLRVFRIHNAGAKVELSDAESFRFAQADSSGARVAFVGGYPLGERRRLRLEIYQERWSLDEASTQSDTGLMLVLPRNETRNTGLTVGLLFGF